MSDHDRDVHASRDAPSSFVTARPVAVSMAFLAAVVFGFFSYAGLPVALMPELTYPTITVRTEYPGAAPEEVENDVSRPLEEALGVIGGLQEISSVSRTGLSDVVLEFSWDTDISDASQDVLEKLDLVFLPDEANRPLILHFDPSLDPIMELSLSGRGEGFEGEQGLRRLRRLAEQQVKRAIEPIKGVAAVRVKGGLEEEIHVLLEEEQLNRTGLSIQQVIDRLRQENINVAGGTIREGRTEYLVRTLNEYENLTQIGETIVTTVDGRDVRISDLGRVVPAHKERQIITRADGGESVQIEIYKEADANIVALAKRVKSLIGQSPPEADAGEESPGATDADAGSRGGRPGRGAEAASRGLAGDLARAEQAVLKVVADRSLFIESSINEVRNTAILGGLLAVIVLFLFLQNVKSTAIIAVSIPISLLVAFAPLNLLGVSLNIMSLGGLALGIGMLVDSSIVVLESIHRCKEEGDDLIRAAIRGTAEVREAVVASTFTSIAVFFPMVFVEGVAGQAFGDLGLAVVVSLFGALVVALFLIPMLASRRGMNLPGGASAAATSRDARAVPGLSLHVASWPRFRDDLRSLPTLARLLVVPVLYRTVLFIFGLLLELIGKLIMLLFVCFVWLITRAGRLISKLLLLGAARRGTGEGQRGSGERVDRGPAWTKRFMDSYQQLLRRNLARPGGVIATVLACLVLTWLGLVKLDSELLPEVRQGEFTIEAALPVGTPLTETDALLRPIEAAILAEREHIQALLVTIGFDPTQSERSDEGEHTARFKVLLERSRQTGRIEDQVIERLRARFAGIPDLDAKVTRPVLFSAKAAIEVEIQGEDLVQLRTQGERASSVMATLPELNDVKTTLERGAPEVEIIYDRDQLARFGLDVAGVARLVRDKVKGFEATRFNLTNRRIPILVQLAADDRRTVADIADLIINPGDNRPIPLAAVAEVRLGEGPSEVRRVDGQRVAVVEANLARGSLSNAVAAIETSLDRDVHWPVSMSFLISGQNKEWERSRGSLMLALALSIFLVYVIMASQFESLVHPLVIIFTIPLAFVGTIAALWALDINLSVVVFLGMIMLAGIVVNNAIVLIDYINRLRRRGLERDDAIVTASAVRLRPIVMTTATTVLGLAPMALGIGDGAEIRTPMAIAVISGLSASTVLTLLVIPVIYSLASAVTEKLPGATRQQSDDDERDARRGTTAATPALAGSADGASHG